MLTKRDTRQNNNSFSETRKVPNNEKGNEEREKRKKETRGTEQGPLTGKQKHVDIKQWGSDV